MRKNHTLFNQNSLLGVKVFDYKDWCKAEIMKTKGHLTQAGLDEIFELKMGINKGRLSMGTMDGAKFI